MKRKFTFLIAAIAAILMMAQPGKAVGQTRTVETLTFNFEDQGSYQSNSSNNSYTEGPRSYSQHNVTISLYYADAVTSGTPISGTANMMGRVAKKTTNSPTMIIGPIDISEWGTVSKVDFKTNGVNTITEKFFVSTNGTDYTEKLSFTLSGNGSSNVLSKTADNLGLSGESLYLKWTGSVSSADNSNNRDFRIDDIVITYNTGGSQQQTVADPTFSLLSENTGTTTYVGDYAMIDCTTANSTIYYTMGNNPDDPDNTSNEYDPNEDIELTGSTTIKAIAYVGDDHSDVVTKSYTVLTPKTTMAQVFAAAGNSATDVAVTFNNWIVAGKTSNNAYVTDGQYGLTIYQSNHGFNSGDKLSGTVVCKVQLYNGGAELTNVTSNSTGLTVTSNQTIPDPYAISLANISGAYIGSYVDLGNLTYNNGVFTDGNDHNITPYDSFSLNNYPTPASGVYRVKGIYIVFGSNATAEIAPIVASDFTQVQLYTVTYNGNGADGGTTPTDNTQYTSGQTVTVLANTFTSTGHTFSHWNTDANGAGDQYDANDEFTITGNTTLYAQWEKNKYNVALSSIGNVTLTATYGDNTITEGQTPTPQIDYNTEITLNATDLSSGKAFVWDVYKTNEPTTKVTVTDNKFNVPAFNVTISGSVVDTYTVTYDCNGGTSGCPSNVTDIVQGTIINLAAAPTKSHYTFNGWNDGSQTYAANAEYTVSNNVTFTAQWIELNYSTTYTSNVTVGSDKVVISDVEYDAYKAGTSSAAGSWTVTVPANTNKLHLHLACWGSENVTLSVTPSGYSSGIALTPNSGISGSSPFTWGSGDNDKDPSSTNHYKAITFDEPLENAVDLTFAATSDKRFVVWGVNAEMNTDPYITAADVDIANNATSGSITYSVHNIPEPAGTLTAYVKTGDWLTLGDVGANVPFTCTANPNAVERTATVTLTYSYGDDETTSIDVTVTQAPKVVTYTYTLATSIESGKHYIITNGSMMIMNSQDGNKRSALNVSENDYYDSEDNEFSIPSNASICEFVINGPDADGYYTIHDANANTGYLYANGNNKNNYLKTQDFNSDYGRWSIAINTTTGDDYGKATILGQGDNTNKYMRYNSDGWFSCYSSGSSVAALPYLYVRNDSYYEFYVDIAKYTTPSVGDPVNGWNFIASPLASAYTLSESDLVAGTYDLYRLNNTTWENYKNDAHDDFTTLVNGQGYLYANSANTTLHFSGAINAFTTAGDANQKVYSEGWNLIGNPYNIPIYINKPYYTLNAERTAIVATAVKNVAIAPCTGVIVEGGTIIFTEASQNVQAVNNGNLQMVLSHNVASRGNNAETIDNAIVSFNEGTKLQKFYFGEPAANIFIPQNGEDYAIAFSNRQGDMPLNFKAKELGTYTISFEGEEMDLNGIYLIDMLDEVEIDLSTEPSYTFIGSPADRSARFKIVFKNNGNDSTSDIFAYQSGSDIVVSGEGELQIFDVMGRMVARQNVNGVQTINAMAHGVYIFKLNEKTQKIIVK